MTDFALSNRRKIAVSSWVTLAAFVVAIWPFYEHLRQVLSPISEFASMWSGAFNFSSGLSTSQLSFTDYMLLPFAEPLVLLAAVILAFTTSNKILRAVPGLLYAFGFLVFWILNFTYLLANPNSAVDVWQWTVGVGPQSFAYVASILLALAGSIIALVEKSPAKKAGPTSGGPGFTAPAANPIGFDTQTGRPIYGYDVNTGEPILG
jgi:hypothetical protein